MRMKEGYSSRPVDFGGSGVALGIGGVGVDPSSIYSDMPQYSGSSGGSEFQSLNA